MEPKPLAQDTALLWVVCLLGLCLGATAVAVPISYDEAWTYLFFSKPGILAAASTYPAPNNHVLFSVFSALSVRLPLETTLALRLVSIAAVLGAVWVFSRLGKTHQKFHAPLAVGVLLLAYPVWQFSWKARGYSLLLLITLVVFLLAVQGRTGKMGARWALASAVSLALGLFTVPTFLYPALAMWIWLLAELLLARKTTQVAWAVGAGVGAAALSVLLYLPILLRQGSDALFGNRFVQPIGQGKILQEFPQQVVTFCSYLTDHTVHPALLGVLFLGLVVFAVLRYKHLPEAQPYLRAAGSLLVLAPLLALVQGVQPPFRALSFLVLPVAIGAGWVLGVPTRLPPYLRGWRVCVAFYALATVLYLPGHLHAWGNRNVDDVELGRLLRQFRFSEMYIQSGELDVLFNYLYASKSVLYKRKNEEWWPGEPFSPLVLDSAHTYSCLVLDAQFPDSLRPQGYRLWYRNRTTQVLLPETKFFPPVVTTEITP